MRPEIVAVFLAFLGVFSVLSFTISLSFSTKVQKLDERNKNLSDIVKGVYGNLAGLDGVINLISNPSFETGGFESYYNDDVFDDIALYSSWISFGGERDPYCTDETIEFCYINITIDSINPVPEEFPFDIFVGEDAVIPSDSGERYYANLAQKISWDNYLLGKKYYFGLYLGLQLETDIIQVRFGWMERGRGNINEIVSWRFDNETEGVELGELNFFWTEGYFNQGIPSFSSLMVYIEFYGNWGTDVAKGVVDAVYLFVEL